MGGSEITCGCHGIEDQAFELATPPGASAGDKPGMTSLRRVGVAGSAGGIGGSAGCFFGCSGAGLSFSIFTGWTEVVRCGGGNWMGVTVVLRGGELGDGARREVIGSVDEAIGGLRTIVSGEMGWGVIAVVGLSLGTSTGG